MQIGMIGLRIQRRTSDALLDYPDWELPAGSMALVTGPSGSGKTTLLHLLAGLLVPDQGRILIGDTAISTLPEHGRDRFRGKHVGIVFQSLHLVPRLTVIDNLMLVAYATGAVQATRTGSPFRQHAESLLDRLDISHLAGVPAATLSNGQAQRVALARALVHRPAVVLADEPTSAVDDLACERILGTLRDASADNGATLVVSSHDRRLHGCFPQHLTLEARS